MFCSCPSLRLILHRGLRGVAHCSRSFLARAALMQPDKPPLLHKEGPEEFCFQEPKNPLRLHPSRTPSITHPGALQSEATARHHPLPATQSQVWLAFVLTHITQTSAETGHRGPFISFALRSCSAVPYWAFLIHHYWQFHLCLLLGISSP